MLSAVAAKGRTLPDAGVLGQPSRAFCETGHTVGRSALQWNEVAGSHCVRQASALKKWARDNPGVGSSARPAPVLNAALRGARDEALRRTTMWARRVRLGPDGPPSPRAVGGATTRRPTPPAAHDVVAPPEENTSNPRGAPPTPSRRRLDPCDPPAGRGDAENVSPGFGRQALEKRRFSLASPAAHPERPEAPPRMVTWGSPWPGPDGHCHPVCRCRPQDPSRTKQC